MYSCVHADAKAGRLIYLPVCTKIRVVICYELTSSPAWYCLTMNIVGKEMTEHLKKLLNTLKMINTNFVTLRHTALICSRKQ